MSEVEYEYGLPDDERLSGVGQIAQAFFPFRFPVEKAPVPTQRGDEIIDIRMDPATGRTYNLYEAIPGAPGEYGPAEFGLEFMPAYRAGKAGLEFFGDLIMDPETRERAANVMKNLPSALSKAGREAVEVGLAASEGIETLQSSEDGRLIDTAESILYAPVPLVAARVLSKIPEGQSVLGVLGGSGAKSHQASFNEYQKLRREGKSNHEAYVEMAKRREESDTSMFFPMFYDDASEQYLMAIPDSQQILSLRKRNVSTPLGTVEQSREGSAVLMDDTKIGIGRVMGGGLLGEVETGTPLLGSAIGQGLIYDPVLLNQYPELKKIRVKTLPGGEPGDGQYSSTEKVIRIADLPYTEDGFAYTSKEFLEERKEERLQQLAAILRHEIQHAIQDIDDRPGGGSPEMFRAREHKALVDKLETIYGNKFRLSPEEKKEVDLIKAQIKELDKENYRKYLSIPGEFEARIAEITTTGLPKGKFYFEQDFGFESNAEIVNQINEIEKYLPGKFDAFFEKDGTFRSLRTKTKIEGDELQKMPPDLLRSFAPTPNRDARGVRVDKDALKSVPIKNLSASSMANEGFKGRSDSSLVGRLQYLEGTLRENLSPKNRAKADAEKRSIEMELRRRNNPESKAMGGPVGGLDVYFNQMRMM